MKSVWKIPPENKKLKVSVAALEIIAVLYFSLLVLLIAFKVRGRKSS